MPRGVVMDELHATVKVADKLSSTILEQTLTDQRNEQKLTLSSILSETIQMCGEEVGGGWKRVGSVAGNPLANVEREASQETSKRT